MGRRDEMARGWLRPGQRVLVLGGSDIRQIHISHGWFVQVSYIYNNAVTITEFLTGGLGQIIRTGSCLVFRICRGEYQYVVRQVAYKFTWLSLSSAYVRAKLTISGSCTICIHLV